MFFGSAYYPEHWPRQRWDKDAQLMSEAGFNTVRMGEFSWAKLEPCEGHYDFSWLDDALQVLYKHGIHAILGTPTATPPKWLMDKHPEIYMEDMYGHIRGFGSRRHYCYNSDVYKMYTEKIVTALAKHYANNSAVEAWQIDNEFTCGDGMYCYCEKCRKAFIEWLKRKYHSLENVNKAWGTVFWSETYTDWNQIITPKLSAAAMTGNSGHNPAFLLDYSRFASDSIKDYCSLQSAILRKYTTKPISHNIVSDLYNYYDIGKELDVASYDNYPSWCWFEISPSDVGFSLDQTRGIKNKNFWIVEQQSGPCGWDKLGNTPRPGQIRMWTYQSLAHGAETLLYFRWRACRFGTEEYWYGILDHDGIPRRRYNEVKAIGNEIQKIAEWNTGSKVVSDILLIRSFEQQWSHTYQSHNESFSYLGLLKSYYSALFKNNYNVDITNENVDYTNYKMVIAPAFNLMCAEKKDKFAKYVKDGGTLLVTFRSGTKNMDNSMTEETLPGYFRTLAGVELEEFDSICFGRKVSVRGACGTAYASVWADIIKPVTAEPIAYYDSEFYSGKPAITVNVYGKGKVIYVGCDLDQKALSVFLDKSARESGIKPALDDTADGVEVVKKCKDSEIFYFILNHSNTEKTIKVPVNCSSILTGKTIRGSWKLQPYGVEIIKED